jgi:hypothetical protein
MHSLEDKARHIADTQGVFVFAVHKYNRLVPLC